MITITTKDATSKAGWMPCPAINLTYPGLAYICPLDELIVVKQSDDFHDLIGDRGSMTGYTIFNNLGQKVFAAVERNKCKKYHLKIFNHYGNEIIHVNKPCTLHPFSKNKVLVWAPPGNFVGVVKELSKCVNTFTAKNWYGEDISKLKAKGLFKYDYKITSSSEEEFFGRVANNWINSTVLNVKNFGVSFPVDLDVMDKVILIGACFLISWLKY